MPATGGLLVPVVEGPGPAGDPGSVLVASVQQEALASRLDAAARGTREATASAQRSGWTGEAADTWAQAAAPPSLALAVAAEAASTAAGALRTWADTLGEAQARWRQALGAAEADVADRQRQAAEAVAAADAAGRPVAAGPGLVEQGSRPHAGLAMVLAQQAQALAADGERALCAGLGAACDLLDEAGAVLQPSTPAPNWAQRHLPGPVAEALTAAQTAMSDSVTSLEKLATLDGATWKAMIGSVRHPEKLLSAMVDWEDLSSGRYAAWIGTMGVSAVANALTDGAASSLSVAGKVARAGEGSSRLARTAETLAVTGAALPSTVRRVAQPVREDDLVRVARGGGHDPVDLRDGGDLPTGGGGGGGGGGTPPPAGGPGGLPDPGDRGRGAAQPRVEHDGLGNPIRDNGLPVPDDYPEHAALSQERMLHIIDGEKKKGKHSGGHALGVGFPKKSEFPPSWSNSDIVQHVMDVVEHPRSGRCKVTPDGAYVVWDVRDGVTIRVMVDQDGNVLMAYPNSGAGVIQNPPKAKKAL